jgi:branched-chain amino acid transport system substrate-binding protein
MGEERRIPAPISTGASYQVRGSNVARIRTHLAIAGVAALALTACADSGGGGASDGGGSATAKIGVFLPLTGENAENGQQIKNAVEMYADAYNKGDHPFDIELVVRDDRGEPKTATNIAREFAQDDNIVAVLGSFSSTASMAAAPVFNTAGIPQISPTSSHPEFTTLGKYVFRGTPTQNLEATLIAKHTVESLGNETAAIIYRQDDWGNSAAEAFKKGFEANGGSIVASEAVAPDSRDFRTLVTSLQGKGAKSLYLALHYSDAAVLAQQMQASGWAPDVITATSLYTHELIELSGGKAVEGWHVPAFFFAESDEPVVKDFVNEFDKRYGQKPNAFGAVGHDAIAVLGAALDKVDKVGSAGRESLGKEIFNVEVPGATGTMKFDENGDVQKPITWLQITGDEFVRTTN